MPLLPSSSELDLLITYFVVTTWSFNIWLSSCPVEMCVDVDIIGISPRGRVPS